MTAKDLQAIREWMLLLEQTLQHLIYESGYYSLETDRAKYLLKKARKARNKVKGLEDRSEEPKKEPKEGSKGGRSVLYDLNSREDL